MQGKTLVDTNILVYLVDKNEKQKYLKAKKWLNGLESSDNYFVAFQNLKEFSNIANKKSLLKAKEINEFVEVFSYAFNLIFDDKLDLIKANLETGKTKGHFWDSLIVSSMKRHEINIILTENIKDFKNFKGIKTENPLA